jgi:hypothetical protein
MRSLKRTYSLPVDTLKKFEQKVPGEQRNAVLAQLLRDWLERDRREELRRQIIEGCRDMADIYLEIEREYHPLEEEVQRALEAPPQAGGNRARSARSRRRV